MTRHLAWGLALVFVVALAAGCGSAEVEVRPDQGGDYNRTELYDAIAVFAAAGRTPEAYWKMAQQLRMLRAGMDEQVANETERRLVVLALEPVAQYLDVPWSTRAQQLATTVWSVGLAPSLARESPDGRYDSQADGLAPKVVNGAVEGASAYLLRLCADVLPNECKYIVPEYQNAIVGALAARRFTERVRAAVSACRECGDPAWRRFVERWEAIDRQFTGELRQISRWADPRRWPLAGDKSEPWEGHPTVELDEHGDTMVEGAAVTDVRVALAQAKPKYPELAVHLLPSATVAQFDRLRAHAKRAGYRELAVVVRSASYPWAKRVYRLPTGGALGRDLRPIDSVQLMLRRMDPTILANPRETSSQMPPPAPADAQPSSR
ncbi:MAG: hypothetical protein IPL79_09825 [Myxococcales bacterium]|nr:hypothetical protein [Myxococcales bacterium]